jgi:DNA-binding CsgD family transcriptional regulator
VTATGSGIPGVGELLPGSHLCALYSTQDERERMLCSFLESGLRRGDGGRRLIDDLDPEAHDLFRYESAVSEVVEESQAVCMCMYDLQRFDARMLIDVLRTHSKVIVDRVVLVAPLRPQTRGHAGPAVLGHGMAAVPAHRHGKPPDLWLTLTGAERRVAELVADGLTNRAVADRLTMSHHTVDAHLKHAYIKLGIHSRVSLTVLALEHLPAHR